MAVKKYLDGAGLGKYDVRIKEYIANADDVALDAAKGYANSLASNYDAAGAAATALADAKKYADGKDTAIQEAKEDAAAAQATAEQGVRDAAAAATAAQNAQTSADNIDAKIGTLPTEGGYTSVVDMINKKTTGIASSATVTELTNRVDNVDARVDTLVGADENKSVRKIANEELVAQLIPEAAKESLDTLSEIAAWIQAHPEDAAAINKKIEDLSDKVGTLPSGQATVVAYIGSVATAVASEAQRAKDEEAALAGRIAAVEGKFTGSDSVATQIASAVAAEAALRESADEAILGEVNTNNDSIAALEGRADDVETSIDEITASLGEGGDVRGMIDAAASDALKAQTGVNDLDKRLAKAEATIGTHTTDISDAADRITELETKVGEGFQAITNVEIEALFTPSA